MTEVAKLVELAKSGDEAAFADLVERFRDWALSRAVAILGDYELAQDVVQEALGTAHASLATLSDSAAFPGWLRTIVRRSCYRALRKHRPDLVPLDAAVEVPEEGDGPDRLAEAEERRHEILSAIGRLPTVQREVILLHYWREFSQGEIAGLLDLPATTVNNRLHAARRQLREEMQAMVENIDNSTSTGSPPSGTVVAVHGPVVEVHFVRHRLPPLNSWLRPTDPQKPLLATVQYLMDGTVRAVAVGNGAGYHPGDEVTDAGDRVAVPIDAHNAREAVARLAAIAHQASHPGGRVETGIKAVDLFAPLVAGDVVGFAARPGVGMVVLIQELLIRRATLPGALTLIGPIPAIERFGHGRSPNDPGAEAPYGIGSVQTAFLPIRDMAAPPAGFLDPVDATITLSRDLAKLGMYPAIDPVGSTSKHLNPSVVGAEHVSVAERARSLLQQFPANLESADTTPNLPPSERLLLERARRLRRFLTQPFYVAGPWIRWPAGHVVVADAVRACAAILDGAYDKLPEDAFYMANGIDDVLARARPDKAPPHELS